MFNPNDEQLEKLMSLVMDTKNKLENEELELYSHLFLQFLAAEIGLSADIKIIPEDDEKHREVLDNYERVKSRLLKEKTSTAKAKAPKYKSPDGNNTWSGYGRMPKFISEHIGIDGSPDFDKNNPEHTRKLEELRIKE